MNSSKRIIAAAAGSALIALALASLVHAADVGAKRHGSGGIGQVPCNDGVVVVSPSHLWPPNHKMVTVDLSYIDNNNDGDAVQLAINSVSSNQDAPDGTSECDPKGPDWVIGPTPVSNTDPNSAATEVQLRAQRCGDKGSRVYDINVTCSDGPEGGNPTRSETVDMLVTVAHDQGKH